MAGEGFIPFHFAFSGIPKAFGRSPITFQFLHFTESPLKEFDLRPPRSPESKSDERLSGYVAQELFLKKSPDLKKEI